MGAKFVVFAGYFMPIHFKMGILQETLHTRQQVGFFDVSHMGQIKIQPKKNDLTAVRNFLERLLPCDIKSLPEGRQCYTFLLDHNGGVIDDLIVANLGSYYRLIVNASRKYYDLRHIKKISNKTCEIVLEEDKGLIAIQGPKSEAVLSKLSPKIQKSKFMDVMETKLLGNDALISRSGYTGEDGFEISADHAAISKITNKILEDGAVSPVGLGARDSLRLEAGLCLYGNELKENINPIEAGLKWAIPPSRLLSKNKSQEFIGFDYVKKEIESGSKFQRAGIIPDGKAPMREGSKIFSDAKGNCEIGIVTSGGFSPSLNHPISMARLLNKYNVLGGKIHVSVRSRLLPAKVVKLPFIKTKYKK